jgi:hypothetical protein
VVTQEARTGLLFRVVECTSVEPLVLADLPEGCIHVKPDELCVVQGEPLILVNRPMQIDLVGHRFQPVDWFAVEVLVDCDVLHRGGIGGSVPMTASTVAPNQIASANFSLGPVLALRPTHAICHEQGLTQRVGVPVGASTWLKIHDRQANTGGGWGRENAVNTDAAGEPVCWPFDCFAGACTMNLHVGVGGVDISQAAYLNVGLSQLYLLRFNLIISKIKKSV